MRLLGVFVSDINDRSRGSVGSLHYRPQTRGMKTNHREKVEDSARVPYCCSKIID